MANKSDYMDIAMELAEQGRGRTSPNPMVGAVLIRDDRIIAKGYHHGAGRQHAEVLAIKSAGEDARGAKLVVTMEPCCIEGRTPPCTDLIVESGIKEVVIGSLDPNPRVNGRGMKLLKDAGLNVTIDKRYIDKIARQNEIFFKYIRTNRPFVIAKTAVSLDGKIAAKRGQKTTLTGDRARLESHILRDQMDAILVGVDTVIVDDPSLTARISGKETKNPVRIIVDSRARIPLDSTIVKTAGVVPTFLAVLPGADPPKLEKLIDLGVSILTTEEKDGQVDLEDLIDWAGNFELTSIIVEGGSNILTSFFIQNLIDKIVFFVAPVIVGGADSVGIIGTELPIMQRFGLENVAQIDADVIIEGYPVKGKSNG